MSPPTVVTAQGSPGFNTLAVQTHGDGAHRNRSHGLPIDRSVTYEAASADEHRRLFRDNATTFYQRFGHPTTAAAGAKVAHLEGAEAGLVFGSGMGAIATSLVTVLRGGDHVVAHIDFEPEAAAGNDESYRAFVRLSVGLKSPTI